MSGSASVLTQGRAPAATSWAQAEHLLALVVVVLIGMRVDLRFGLQVGPLLALVLAPVWLGRVRRVRWVPLLTLALATSAVVGIALTTWNADQGTSQSLLLTRSALLVSIFAALGGLLWARGLMSTSTVTIAFGVGMVAGIPFNTSTDPNQWRFTYSVPVIVLVLALVSAYRGPGRVPLQVAACLALALVGLLNDSRSNSAMLLLAALAVAWHAVDHLARRGKGGVYFLGVWAVCGFFIVQSAVLSGSFGETIQARTQAQIEQSGGNLLLGGRPEVAASVELISNDPWGLGSGTLASYDTISRAKTGMAAIGYDPNNGYVERFMFGNGLEVHSSLGDYWLWFGIPGVVLVGLFVLIAFRGVQRLYEGALLTVLPAYLATRVAWDTLFSPAASSVALLVLALVIFLPPGPGEKARPGRGLLVQQSRPGPPA